MEFQVDELAGRTTSPNFRTSSDALISLLAAIHEGLLFRAEARTKRPLTPEAQAKGQQRHENRLQEASRLLRRHFADGVPFSREGLLPNEPLVDVESHVSGTGQGAARVHVIRQQLSDAALVLGSIGRELRALLDEMAWLGPLRSAPERFYARDQQAAGIGGQGDHVAMYLYDNETR